MSEKVQKTFSLLNLESFDKPFTLLARAVTYESLMLFLDSLVYD